jgi:hypothetical protein
MSSERKYDRSEWVPKICARLAEGEPLAVICRDIGIPRRTVNQWRQDDADIDALFLEARDDGFDSIASGLRKIVRRDGRKGKDSITSVQRDKLIAETEMKLLAKWDPRRYGEKLITENTTHTTVEVVDTDEMDRRLDRAIAAAGAAISAGEPDATGA